jgi:hypothetical protein
MRMSHAPSRLPMYARFEPIPLENDVAREFFDIAPFFRARRGFGTHVAHQASMLTCGDSAASLVRPPVRATLLCLPSDASELLVEVK